MLVSDEPFNGVVVRDARREICVLDEAAPGIDGVDKTSGDFWFTLVQRLAAIGMILCLTLLSLDCKA